MIVVHADVFAQIPYLEDARAAMRSAQAAAIEQDGCVSFQFAEVLGDPGHFVAVERWRDMAALQEHFRSAAFSAYQEAIAPLLVRDSEVLVLEAEGQMRPVESSGLDLRQDD